MRKLTMILTAVMFVLGTMAMYGQRANPSAGCGELPSAASERDAVRQAGGMYECELHRTA